MPLQGGIRMRLRISIYVLLCSVLVLTAVTASATQILYRSPKQMGQESETAVRGTVVSVESYWNDTHSKIFTRTRISVDETYKGAEQAAIDIIQLGGVVDGVRVTVHGALQWHVGEEVLLFAERYDAAHYRVSGFSQGKFEVERDPETGVIDHPQPARR